MIEVVYYWLWSCIGAAALFDMGRGIYMALAHKLRVVPIGGGIFWMTVMLVSIYGGST